MQSRQDGRSMIEMLAVLAIVGLLSIGAVWGFALAIARHRANQIQNYVLTCVTTSYTKSLNTFHSGFCQDVLEEKIPIPVGLSEYDNSLDVKIEIPLPDANTDPNCYKGEGVYHNHCAFIQANMNVMNKRILKALLQKNEGMDGVDNVDDLARHEGQVVIYGYENMCQDNVCPVAFHFVGSAKDITKTISK